ncbi:MAG: AMP-binding protein [Desulfobacterium sp.]|nr:AMP-binding protein [Desulfobacterium sp.]
MIPVPRGKIDEYTQKGWWGNTTVLDLFFETVRKRPDAEALVDPLNRADLIGGKAKRLTYRETATRVDRLALGFERLGIQKDDVILVQLPNVVESVLVFFAAARIGAISSPLSMMARSREVGHALEATQAKAVVTVGKFNGFDHLGLMAGLKERFDFLKQIILAGEGREQGVSRLETLLSHNIDPPLPVTYFDGKASGPNEIFTICWTSGTEAEPKGVPRTHNHWIAIARVTAEGCRVKEGDNIHGTFPVINMAGIGGLMVPWVLTGGKFVLHHPFDIGVFFKQMATENIYYTLMPPALLDTLAKSPKACAIQESNVKVIASGSVPLSPWMVKYYQETFNISIVNFFASNEGIALFSGPGLFPDPDDRARYFPRFGCKEVSLDISDRVIGGMDSAIVDVMTGEEITETGVVGELCFKGSTMFEGYWQQRALTEKAFDARGYYHSGDLFSIQGEGRDKLLFHGRFKDLIIRGGQNISPEEVETLVVGHPGIVEAAAVGYPDPRLGERTCVFVVVPPGRTITLEEIVLYLGEQGVAKYKYPERLEVLEQLPRSALNKVLRRKLRDMLNHKPAKEQ